MKIDLINETKSSLDEVVNSLTDQKFGTKWAEKTNIWAADYARKLGEVYGDVWYKGSLPEEFFLNIKLPEHRHEDQNLIFFPLDTSLSDAREWYKNQNAKDNTCLDLINYLKEEIRQKGFTSSVVLAVINGELKHVDGLHRMIALASLLEEGFVYKPISVFLCNSTKY